MNRAVALSRVASSVTQEASRLNRTWDCLSFSPNPRDAGLSFHYRHRGFHLWVMKGNNPQKQRKQTFTRFLIQRATRAAITCSSFGGDLRFSQQNAFRDVESRGAAYSFSPFAQISGNALR